MKIKILEQNEKLEAFTNLIVGESYELEYEISMMELIAYINQKMAKVILTEFDEKLLEMLQFRVNLELNFKNSKKYKVFAIYAKEDCISLTCKETLEEEDVKLEEIESIILSPFGF